MLHAFSGVFMLAVSFFGGDFEKLEVLNDTILLECSQPDKVLVRLLEFIQIGIQTVFQRLFCLTIEISHILRQLVLMNFLRVIISFSDREFLAVFLFKFLEFFTPGFFEVHTDFRQNSRHFCRCKHPVRPLSPAKHATRPEIGPIVRPFAPEQGFLFFKHLFVAEV